MSLTESVLTPKVIYEARDFSHERYSKCTELLNYLWQLKRNKKIPSIEWKIVRKAFCDAKSNYCLLFLKEKYKNF